MEEPDHECIECRREGSDHEGDKKKILDWVECTECGGWVVRPCVGEAEWRRGKKEPKWKCFKCTMRDQIKVVMEVKETVEGIKLDIGGLKKSHGDDKRTAQPSWRTRRTRTGNVERQAKDYITTRGRKEGEKSERDSIKSSRGRKTSSEGT